MCVVSCGDINMHSELRDDDIWGKEKTFSLLTDFFEKHNKNKSKKRKTSVMDDDNDDDDNVATDTAAINITASSPPPLREVTDGAAVDRYVISALNNLIVA